MAVRQSRIRPMCRINRRAAFTISFGLNSARLKLARNDRKIAFENETTSGSEWKKRFLEGRRATGRGSGVGRSSISRNYETISQN